MRLIFLTTSTNNTNTFLGSLESLGEHEISVIRYDAKWHDLAYRLVQQDQKNLAPLQSGQLRIKRDDCAMDDEMLTAAKIGKPDAIVYVSAWQGDFVPLNETLGELNQIAPMVHILCDGGDHPWWPQLKEFERRGTFSLTVNIDGSHMWPGGRDWKDAEWDVKNAMTLLTPVDTRYFDPPSFSFGERPFAIGYAGNNSGPFRDSVVQRLQGVRGFSFRQRDTNPNSYPFYCDFLKHARVSVSVPFTGTGQARHVKGRVIESAYAGCCVLEWANDATASWFSERAEYWAYNSVEECAELAEWLAHHPRIAGDTAEAMQETVRAEHSPEMFWGEVLGTLKGDG